jgi:hypothetical protein
MEVMFGFRLNKDRLTTDMALILYWGILLVRFPRHTLGPRNFYGGLIIGAFVGAVLLWRR